MLRYDSPPTCLDYQSLNLILERTNLALQLARLITRDAGRDDCPGDARGTTERCLGRDPDVRHVLVFAQEREMEEDCQGGGVGCEDAVKASERFPESFRFDWGKE